MSLFAILLLSGPMVLSLWATMRVRQVYGKFSQLPASSGLTGALHVIIQVLEAPATQQVKDPLPHWLAETGLAAGYFPRSP